MELYLCEELAERRQVYDLLAWAARRRWGLDRLPAVERAAGGKPYFPDRPDLCFNLSHSGSIALCVLDEQPVGADVERVRKHYVNLPKRICSEKELAWLDAQAERDRALCTLWTGKESLVKYTGAGLTVPIRGIAAPLPPETEADGLHFYRLSAPEYELCACGHTPAQGVVRVSAGEIERKP